MFPKIFFEWMKYFLQFLIKQVGLNLTWRILFSKCFMPKQNTINKNYFVYLLNLCLFSTGIMAEERGATLYATDERYDKYIQFLVGIGLALTLVWHQWTVPKVAFSHYALLLFFEWYHSNKLRRTKYLESLKHVLFRKVLNQWTNQMRGSGCAKQKVPKKVLVDARMEMAELFL